MQEKMKIDYLDISKIKPYKRNAKKHPQEQIDQIVKSIEQFGNNDPIAVWGKDNVIVEGHGRYLALKQMGVTGEIPVIHLDHLTEEERRVYGLVHNKLTMNSGWDFDLLELEFNDIDPELFDMADFGFFQDDEQDKAPTEVTEDDFDESTVTEAVCKRGQIWQLGEHRLMCGDSTDADDVSRLMNGEKADMVFTDPPYGVAIGDKNAMLNSVQPSGRCCTNIEGDTMSEAELYDMLKTAFINVRENCKDDACYFVTSPQGGSLGLMMMMMMMMRAAGLEVRHVLMWRNFSATFSLGRLDYDYQHEPIFYTWTKSHHNYRKGKYRTTIWDFDKPRKCDLHPTMKPVELVANAMLDGSKEGDIILDSFGGSGTTMIAAEQLSRYSRLMELDPHYCDVIIKRWEDFTGRKAELIEE